MNCTCQRAVREERAAICDYIEAIGQRTIATRIRDGRHLEPVHREHRKRPWTERGDIEPSGGVSQSFRIVWEDDAS
jgi:hypothetical protein